MITKLRKRLANEEGFTLIELLVVILIIGILAAVAIPTFLSQKSKANDSNAQSNLKSAQTVVEAYANGNNGVYPTASSIGLISAALTSSGDATTLANGQNPVYYTSGGGSADTYNLCSQGTSGRLWWIEVSNGTATFYVQTGTTGGCVGASAPTNSSTATQFPSVNQ